MITEKKSNPMARNLTPCALRFRAGILAGLCVVFSACSISPGMRMLTPATLPETSKENGDPATKVQIPITTIDLTLIRQMHTVSMQTHSTEQLGLFAKPTPYKVGPGD